MIILLDVDGVVCDFVGPALQDINTYKSWQLTHSDVSDFNIWHSVGLSPYEANLCKRNISRPGFFLSLPVLPGAQDAVALLRQLGRVVFVTAPWQSSPYFGFDRMRWLRRYFGTGPDDLIVATDKSLVCGDIFIDDKAQNVCSWQDAHPNATALLLSHPWNQSDTNCRRINSLDDAVNLIKDKKQC